jgi:hypothetical protein
MVTGSFTNVLYGKSNWKCGQCGTTINIEDETWNKLAIWYIQNHYFNLAKGWAKILLVFLAMGVLWWVILGVI